MKFDTKALGNLAPTDEEANAAADIINQYIDNKLKLLEQTKQVATEHEQESRKRHTELLARLERIGRGVQSIQNDFLRFMPAVESVFNMTAQTASDQVLMEGRLRQVETKVESLRLNFDEWRRAIRNSE